MLHSIAGTPPEIKPIAQPTGHDIRFNTFGSRQGPSMPYSHLLDFPTKDTSRAAAIGWNYSNALPPSLARIFIPVAALKLKYDRALSDGMTPSQQSELQ